MNHSQTWHNWWGSGTGALIESLGRISTNRNLCDFADTACQPQETSWVIRVAWEEVKTSGFVTLFLHLAGIVIHSGESAGTSSIRSMSLNNFSYPRFEQSTKVVKLSFRLCQRTQKWLEQFAIKGKVLISKAFTEMICFTQISDFPPKDIKLARDSWFKLRLFYLNDMCGFYSRKLGRF